MGTGGTTDKGGARVVFWGREEDNAMECAPTQPRTPVPVGGAGGAGLLAPSMSTSVWVTPIHSQNVYRLQYATPVNKSVCLPGDPAFISIWIGGESVKPFIRWRYFLLFTALGDPGGRATLGQSEQSTRTRAHDEPSYGVCNDFRCLP